MNTMTSERCPRCGKQLLCLGGCSAHPDNWYCEDEKGCGYQAWNRTNLPQPAQAVDVDAVREVIAEMQIKAPTVKPAHLDNWAERLTRAISSAPDA